MARVPTANGRRTGRSFNAVGSQYHGVEARGVHLDNSLQEQLEENDGFYRALVENADDIVYAHDLEGRFCFVNEAAVRLTGYDRVDLLSKNGADLFVPEYKHETRKLVAEAVDGPCSQTLEGEILTRDGQRRAVEINIRPMYRDNEIVGIQGIARDTTRRKNLERQLEYLAGRDYLTGLLNRRRFEEELQVHLAQARRYGVTGALLYLDLDHFKDVNDSFGHPIGDELLVSVGQLLSERLPQTGAIARLGGDEFTIILPRTETNEARQMAEQVLAWLRNSPFQVAEHRIAVSASIGITLVTPDGMSTAEQLLSCADMAMYQAKENGRNCVCVYSADIDWRSRIESGLTWRKRISEALEADQLLLYAQPILDVRRDHVSQYEMLARIPDGSGRIIDASQFIESAERFGFVQSIDRWAMRRTIELLAEYSPRYPDLVLEVNVSAAAMGDDDLLQMVRDELAAKPVDPSRLVVEITETVAMANIHQAQQFVSRLKRLGCRFALDDFGVGFSSFYQLKHLDVDYLKIDGSFIRDLPRDPVDRHLVRAIVEVARALGKKTIAEFVTDQPTLRIIEELGVDYAQGYFVGQPQDAREILGKGIVSADRVA